MTSLTDDEALIKVATETRSWEIRAMAAERLTDPELRQRVLASVLIDAKDWRQQQAGLMAGIQIESEFARVATWARAEGAAIAAVNRVSTEELLVSVAQQSVFEDVAMAALIRFTSVAALESVASVGHYESVATAAVRRIEDPGALTRVAIAGQHPSASTAAVEQLSDDARLLEVALASSHRGVRLGAARRVTSQDLLLRIALEGEGDVRNVALNAGAVLYLSSRKQRLHDPEMLARIVAESQDHDQVRAAEMLLSHQQNAAAGGASKNGEVSR